MNPVLLFMLLHNFWAFNSIHSSYNKTWLRAFLFGSNQLGNWLTSKKTKSKGKAKKSDMFFIGTHYLSCQVYVYILHFKEVSSPPFPFLPQCLFLIFLLFFPPQYLANAMGKTPVGSAQSIDGMLFITFRSWDTKNFEAQVRIHVLLSSRFRSQWYSLCNQSIAG